MARKEEAYSRRSHEFEKEKKRRRHVGEPNEKSKLRRQPKKPEKELREHIPIKQKKKPGGKCKRVRRDALARVGHD